MLAQTIAEYKTMLDEVAERVRLVRSERARGAGARAPPPPQAHLVQSVELYSNTSADRRQEEREGLLVAIKMLEVGQSPQRRVLLKTIIERIDAASSA